jgi:2'-5' RNA ligase
MALPFASNGAPRQYALVSYIPEPLGAFLNQLRCDLVPGCRLLSHVTLLPPRLLDAPEPRIVEELASYLAQVPAFELEVGEVEIFPVTEVVYLAIRHGRQQLAEIHRLLNQGALAFDEPFEYHPHVTLAQQMPGGAVGSALEQAAADWRRWTGSHRFAVENLTFVRNVNPERWETVSEHPLQQLSLLRTT